MKKMIIIQVILFFICFGVHLLAQDLPGEGEEFQKLAQSTMTFLNIDIGGRGVGMGGSYTCIENDVNALFWNPAGIARIKGGALSVNHTQWLADTKQYALAAAYGSGNLGTFGVSLMAMDNGSIERTVPDRNAPRGFHLDGSFNVEQWAAGLAYGRQITNKFSIGGQVKYAYQNLGDADIMEWSSEAAAFDTVNNIKNQEGAIAFDFGTIYHFGFKDLRFGMSLRNFARPVEYCFESFNLPITFRVGLAMNMLSIFSGMEAHDLQICVEAVHPYDERDRIHIGGEYVFKDLFAVRAGYRTNSDVGSMAFGFGLTPRAFGGLNLRIDYAYSDSDADKAFGSIHRFSFGFGL